MKRVIYIMMFINLFLVIGVLIFLSLYSNNAYVPIAEQATAIDALDTTMVTRTDASTSIQFTVDNPIRQIVFLPGGLVEAESYEYLAYSLAIEGYNVTIFKPFFNLAIITPNYAKRFLSDDLDNVVIGHSLGGTVASLLASGRDSISTVIFLASYPIQDLTDKEVLLITAEFDGLLDMQAVEDSVIDVPEDTVYYNIIGGNHAQFGWYGEQLDDNTATITTQEQQDLIIEQILLFLND